MGKTTMGCFCLTLGLVFLICALVITVLGVATPLLENLRVSPLLSGAFLLLLFAAWFLIPKEAALLTAAAGIPFLVRLRWWRGRVLAILAAVAGGLAAFFVLLAVDSFREAGMLAALCSAIMAVSLGKFRRGRLFAGFAAPLVTMVCAAMAEAVLGAVVYGGDNAFFDLSVGSVLLTSALTGVLELVKRRKMEL